MTLLGHFWRHPSPREIYARQLDETLLALCEAQYQMDWLEARLDMLHGRAERLSLELKGPTRDNAED